MTMYGTTGATPHVFLKDDDALLITPHTQPTVTLVAPYVCDYKGIARPVAVPVGTTLIEFVDAAFQKPTFIKGVFLGFEDENLSMTQPVTSADATRWTADSPLKLKYERNDSCLIL
ncbi:hypothetical protein Plhal304r1_c050g0133111 [Plasmopara halstedii]